MLSGEIRSWYSVEQLYADDVAFFRETLRDLKGRQDAWKEVLDSKRLIVNIKKSKTMMSSENGERLQWKAGFCAVCRKGVGSNSILCQFFRCWVLKRDNSGIRGKLKEDNKFKYQICANQQTDILEDCSVRLETGGKFCYCGDSIRN